MLHLRHIAALLLATTCSLCTEVSRKHIEVCGGDAAVLHLNCESGVIHVDTAQYGANDCSGTGTRDFMMKMCDGKKDCEMSIKKFRESNNCFQGYECLNTLYTCLPAVHLVVCESSTAFLFCGEGYVIHVIGADYGRRDKTTCSYQWPENNVNNIYCSSPTNKVSESCDGKNTCTIQASNSVFGEPCRYTYKYLEVAYVCLRTRYFSSTMCKGSGVL